MNGVWEGLASALFQANFHADFLATPAAAMTRIEDNDKFEKCNQFVRELFSDNAKLVVQRLSCKFRH